MSSPNDGAILVGFLALLGVVISPVVTGYLNRAQQRELARHAYIDGIVKRLIELRAKLQFFQIISYDIKMIEEDTLLTSDEKFKLQWEKAHNEEFKEMQLAFGEAFSIMLSVDIEKIRNKAQQVMSPENTIDEKLQAINSTLEELGKEYAIFNRN